MLLYRMPNTVRRAHTEGLLALFSQLSVDSLDVETVAATYLVDIDIAEGAFRKLECEGYVTDEGREVYQLTESGERAIKPRGGSPSIPADD